MVVWADSNRCISRHTPSDTSFPMSSPAKPHASFMTIAFLTVATMSSLWSILSDSGENTTQGGDAVTV